MGPSKPPTKREREWMARVADYGCIACRMEGNFRDEKGADGKWSATKK